MSKFKAGDKVVYKGTSGYRGHKDAVIFTVETVSRNVLGREVLTLKGERDVWQAEYFALAPESNPEEIKIGDEVQVRSSNRPEIDGEWGVLGEISGIRYAVYMTTGVETGKTIYTTEPHVSLAPKAATPKEKTFTFTESDLTGLVRRINARVTDRNAAIEFIERKLNPTHTQTFTVTLEVDESTVIGPDVFLHVRGNERAVKFVSAVEITGEV